MGTRPGPVKEKVAAFQRTFVELIHEFASTAQRQSELPPDDDPTLLAFEPNGIILAANTSLVLYNDATASDLAGRIVRRRLGVGEGVTGRLAARLSRDVTLLRRADRATDAAALRRS